MTTRRSRAGAYADLVAGLLDVRPDPATERFDAELRAAEDEGRIDAQTARVLRWWQRESLRAMVEHARAVVPPTLLALEASATGARREVESASQSWARADVAALPGDAVAGEGVDTSTGDEGTGEEGTGEEARRPPVAGEQAATEQIVLPAPADLSEHRRRLLVAGLTRVRG